MSTIERIQFRLIAMRCCGHMLCWVNPRFPTYCPQCGKSVYPTVKQWVMQSDFEAELHMQLTEERTERRFGEPS